MGYRPKIDARPPGPPPNQGSGGIPTVYGTIHGVAVIDPRMAYRIARSQAVPPLHVEVPGPLASYSSLRAPAPQAHNCRNCGAPRLGACAYCGSP